MDVSARMQQLRALISQGKGVPAASPPGIDAQQASAQAGTAGDNFAHVLQELMQHASEMPNLIVRLPPPFGQIVQLALASSRGDAEECFTAAQEAVAVFHKHVEQGARTLGNSNWWLPVMRLLLRHLTQCAFAADTADRESRKDTSAGYRSPLERAVDSLMRLFRTSISAGKSEARQGASWRRSVRALPLATVTLLFPLWFRMKNYSAGKTVPRVISQRQLVLRYPTKSLHVGGLPGSRGGALGDTTDSLATQELPTEASAAEVRQAIAEVESRLDPDRRRVFPLCEYVEFEYYLGRFCLFEEEYDAAEKHLLEALRLCDWRQQANLQKILMYLAPLQMMRGIFPSQQAAQHLPTLITQLTHLVRHGLVAPLDDFLDEYMLTLVDLGIWHIAERLRDVCLARFLNSVFHAWLRGTTHCPWSQRKVLRLNMLLDCCGAAGWRATSDSLQARLTSLIRRKILRGYVAHGSALVIGPTRHAHPPGKPSDMQSIVLAPTYAKLKN
ncbi:MAG: hypothetical protein MHM6MM_001978 [Cercozoa sp. M6MM]